MSEHPVDVLRQYVRDLPVEQRWHSLGMDAEAALRAVEQLVEEARQLDKWHPQTQIGLAGLHPQHAGCVEAFRAALALFDRKEQTP